MIKFFQFTMHIANVGIGESKTNIQLFPAQQQIFCVENETRAHQHGHKTLSSSSS